jgi:hypothetical protein
MIRTMLAALGLAAAVLAGLPVTRAEAQTFRTYVAPNGGGTLCTFAAPCATLQNAHDATFDGGTVECLPGGQLGVTPLTISRSITIDCASPTWFVSANAHGIKVTLRNMVISSFESFNNSSGSAIGINFINGDALIVDHCTIQNFDSSTAPSGGPGIGIKFAPADGVTAKLHVIDSVITGNGLASSGGGIVVQPAGSGSARVVIERTQVENNTYGIFANGTGSTGLISVQVRDSVVSNSAQSGISSFTSAIHSVVSTVVDRSSSLLNGANGILAQGSNAFVFLKDSTVMSNVTGLNAVSGGAIFSYQNNGLTANVTDGAPTAVLTVK